SLKELHTLLWRSMSHRCIQAADYSAIHKLPSSPPSIRKYPYLPLRIPEQSPHPGLPIGSPCSEKNRKAHNLLLLLPRQSTSPRSARQENSGCPGSDTGNSSADSDTSPSGTGKWKNPQGSSNR